MIRAYKAFDMDLSCTSGGNRFQYSTEGWNEEPEANCVRNGFHCAENPLDCLTYYKWGSCRMFEVEADGDIDEDAVDSKISCTRLRLVRELDLQSYMIACAEYMRLHPARKMKTHSGIITSIYDRGIAQEDGGIIVRGIKPRVMAAKGAIIVLISEDSDGYFKHASIFQGTPHVTYTMEDDGRIARCDL